MLYNNGVMRKALIFDLDGTLWDSSFQVAEAWNEVLSAYSPSSPLLTRDDVLAQMGLVMEDIARNITPPTLEEEKREQFIIDCFRREIDFLSIHPGHLFDKEEETLALLKQKGFPLFIVSNCQSGYIETYLKALKAPYFSGHLCFDDTKKPKSVTIRTLMERHSIQDAFYIGDTATDEQACKEAGVPFLFASYGFGKASCPLASLETIASLPEVLESLGESGILH